MTIGAVAAALLVGTATASDGLAPLHDIVGPWAMRSTVPLVLGIAAAVVAAGLLLAWWFLRMRQQPPPLSPREVAQQALDALRTTEVSAYEASVKVSDILRRFIHDEYGLDAINKTSMEFLNSLQTSEVFTAQERYALADFLDAADMIKFARAQATTKETDALFATAEQIISTTKKEEATDANDGTI